MTKDEAVTEGDDFTGQVDFVGGDDRPHLEAALHINVKRFRGGLVYQAHRLL